MQIKSHGKVFSKVDMIISIINIRISSMFVSLRALCSISHEKELCSDSTLLFLAFNPATWTVSTAIDDESQFLSEVPSETTTLDFK